MPRFLHDWIERRIAGEVARSYYVTTSGKVVEAGREPSISAAGTLHGRTWLVLVAFFQVLLLYPRLPLFSCSRVISVSRSIRWFLRGSTKKLVNYRLIRLWKSLIKLNEPPIVSKLFHAATSRHRWWEFVLLRRRMLVNLHWFPSKRISIVLNECSKSNSVRIVTILAITSRFKFRIFLGNRLIILRKSCNKLSVILLEIERYIDTISWKSRTTYQSLRRILKLEFKVNSNLRSLENFDSFY